MHWCINHNYKLCSVCPNYAFKYDSDRIHHEQFHLPIGCSSCDVEFTKYCHETISGHYKKFHQSFLCDFCSGVIQPFSKYPEHVEKKHNTISFTSLSNYNGRIYELVGDENELYFNCFMCDKRKHTNMLFGHYIFYHNFSIHTLKKFFDMTPHLKINGAVLNKEGVPEIEIEYTGSGEGKEKCNVCENPLEDEDFLKAKELHGIFCQGYVVCSQPDCNRMFKNGTALTQHLENEHETTCRFGCNSHLNPQDINDHLQNLHDIIECFLCNIVNSSGQFKNHLRDQHSVNLMTYEKAMSKAKSKLYHVEKDNQVLCNFCDQNLTDEIKEFSFVNHYKEQHEITMTAILRNLDKNPIIDVILSDKQLRDEDMLKHFAIVKQFDKLVETDFDASKVSCIGVEHVEQKPLSTICDETQHVCEFCNKPFEAACRLYEHLTAMHGFRLLNLNDCDECHSKWQHGATSDEDNKDFNLSLVCPFDESFHVTKCNFKDHLKAEHLDETLSNDKIIYKCLVCSFTYKNIQEIRDHFNITHPDVKMKYCKICRYKLSNNDHEHFMQNHEMAVKKSEKLCCKICKKEFSKATAAKTHFEKTHNQLEHGKKRLPGYKCQFSLCSLTFENKEDRRMHMLFAHPDEKIFACKFCDQKFNTKSSLSSHTVIHKNIIYTCDHCQKSFQRRDSYKEHLLIHSDVRLKCSFCEKVFVQRSNLVRHERIHLQEKPYKCSYCEKTFSDKGACTSHEKVHTREEASNCEVCGKHFARKQKLKYHMR